MQKNSMRIQFDAEADGEGWLVILTNMRVDQFISRSKTLFYWFRFDFTGVSQIQPQIEHMFRP